MIAGNILKRKGHAHWAWPFCFWRSSPSLVVPAVQVEDERAKRDRRGKACAGGALLSGRHGTFSTRVIRAYSTVRGSTAFHEM